MCVVKLPQLDRALEGMWEKIASYNGVNVGMFGKLWLDVRVNACFQV